MKKHLRNTPTRRDFLATSSCGLGTLALASLLKQDGLLAATIELQGRWDFKARLHYPFIKQGRMCLNTCCVPDIADLCQNLICTFKAYIHPHQAVKKRLHHG
jgi:hypothetical protein